MFSWLWVCCSYRCYFLLCWGFYFFTTCPLAGLCCEFAKRKYTHFCEDLIWFVRWLFFIFVHFFNYILVSFVQQICRLHLLRSLNQLCLIHFSYINLHCAFNLTLIDLFRRASFAMKILLFVCELLVCTFMCFLQSMPSFQLFGHRFLQLFFIYMMSDNFVYLCFLHGTLLCYYYHVSLHDT